MIKDINFEMFLGSLENWKRGRESNFDEYITFIISCALYNLSTH